MTMQLYTFPSSPFGCKVKAVVYACKLENTVSVEEFHPWQPDPFFRDLNPLGKIPVLKINEQEVIFDSPVICEYLMEKSGKIHELMPDKYRSLKIQALIDGMAEAAVSIRYERHFRPKDLQSEDWCKRQYLAITSGLNYLNKICETILNQEVLFENLCVASFMSYVELRFQQESLDKIYPNIFDWYHKFYAKHSFLDAAKAKDKAPPDTITRLVK